MGDGKYMLSAHGSDFVNEKIVLSDDMIPLDSSSSEGNATAISEDILWADESPELTVISTNS